MKEDNGIIVIENKNKSKQKYQVLTCFTLFSNNKDYLVYSTGKEDEETILIYISEINIIDDNHIELLEIKSESTLVKIGILLKQIFDKKVDTNIYELKSINLDNKFKSIGYKNIKIEPDYYKFIKKDYNSHKKERLLVGEHKQMEATIIDVKTPTQDFINQFKIDKKYTDAIRNI